MIHGKIFGFPFRLFGILHENQNACFVYYARHSIVANIVIYIFYAFLGKTFRILYISQMNEIFIKCSLRDLFAYFPGPYTQHKYL